MSPSDDISTLSSASGEKALQGAGKWIQEKEGNSCFPCFPSLFLRKAGLFNAPFPVSVFWTE